MEQLSWNTTKKLPQSRSFYSKIQSSTANLCLLVHKKCVMHNESSRFLAPQIHVTPLKPLLRRSALTLSVFPVKLLMVEHLARTLEQDQTTHASGKGNKCLNIYIHQCLQGRVTAFLSLLGEARKETMIM